MRATNQRDSMLQQAARLLPSDKTGPFTTAVTRPDFGLDALDFVELVVQVEQHFGFQFSAEELADLRTVQLLLDNGAERVLRRQLYAEFFAQLIHQLD